MRLVLFTLLAVAACYPLAAQKNSSKYIPGFIVDLNKDTTGGFILDGTDVELSLEIKFKKTTTDQNETRYQPSNTICFGFMNGRFFRRFPLAKDAAKDDSVFVFGKKNLEGKISFYTYKKLKGNEPDIFLTNNSSHQGVHLKEPQKFTVVGEAGDIRTGESFQHIGLLSIIKTDSLNNAVASKKFKYNEKAIRMDILRYNELFKNDFPVSEYHPQIDYSYAISAGLPFASPNPVALAFRVAIYRHKMFPERTRKMSFIRGISYRYSDTGNTIDNSIKDGNVNYRQQFLSLIPIGVNFQGDSRKFISPYVYLGVGLALLVETNHNVVNYEDIGNKNELFLFPVLNMGAGLKIKLGSKFVIAEVTPTGNKSGTCFNIGYSL